MLQCVRILLENGANPLSFRTGEDGNLLHFAVEAADHLKGLSIEGKDSSLCLREIIEPMKPHLNDKDLNGISFCHPFTLFLSSHFCVFFSYHVKDTCI